MALVAEMTAVVLDGFGGPEVLKPAKVERPRPGPGEVLIEVHAAGVNRPDVLQRMGAYPPPSGAPAWPGLEVAGLVAELGEGVDRFAEGEPVMALLPGGGYAEFAVAPAGSVLPVPAGVSMVEAAAMPETFFTVWHNVIERGGLMAGETLLVHGGSSGIGTTAIQLARARNARVVATAGSAEKCARLVELGADRAVDYHTQDFVEVVREATGGRGADVILDMVGGDYLARNLKAAAADARIVQIAFLRGQKAELDIALLMARRITVTGSTLRARDAAFKAGIAQAIETHVWPLVEEGRVRPIIDRTFPLEQAADAHRAIDADHFGKIVLTTARHADR
ncbi:Alcohol dehydrogenase GroES-like domain-containing protein [Aureimonas altamirensis DSM 21988]|uniref:Alcohol dehydrogenase, zinc-containing n=2 Tax=Aureimonas altamirensis TaxID=370622 RepID=A0A0N7KX17_9HYPH|nr:NAD(P)H-quinone oxidoreductase [Aureimonas altamirensis]BAT25673.1 alcohol dehydrogenase, zinc-containing [Aureimonas altamirensis]SHI43925.1 Alcohol dehydrogenase GroES-like domain-containing protein [Aureimonas altamirensis DSM 21988]